MSSDLVERLFNRAAIHDDDAWGPNNDTLCRDAAVEIQSLRDRLTRLRSENAELVAERDQLRVAVTLVREIIKDGAMTGFNCHDGDWAERLFASQAVTHRALSRVSGGGTP